MSLFDEKKEPVIFNLGVDETATYYLKDTVRWTKFMAVLGLIFTGLLILLGAFISFGAAFAGLQNAIPGYGVGFGAGMFVMYLVFGALYLYPIICLLKFSSQMKAALRSSDVMLFNSALRYQRNMWKFMGILMIILLCFYGVVLILALAGLAMR